ncbi:MAG: hypothetical protein QF819_02080 [Gemmatimonadota bacterium]|jgi:hypothetical protein|nr:hypothetical protein [Gemmatimonadota bacterium]MDP6461874.1 hypothetical protein [Gemmatimonadota bacterium]MDP6530122.1 hypothetical protein [Gemmatimonadota bacterium]MDP6801950.1 hypothetical protein [Gemmatimonadota bacterium]MDP7031298.1 hypothetical protein [Gemmatimonadota bacterium]
MHSSPFFNLGEPDDGPGQTAYFVLEALLRSRGECGFESNSGTSDEDVNIYLVHLLSSLMGTSSATGPASCVDSDVFEKVRTSTDPRWKCEVYRQHADELLLRTGLFATHPYVGEGARRSYAPSARMRIGRGKTYYRFASRYHERIRGTPADGAVSQVCGKLATDFERYVDVLFHMKSEYFNLYERMKEDDIMALRQDPLGGHPEDSPCTEVSSLRDDFLDAYWLWHKNPDPVNRNVLIEAVKRLRAADPSFLFQFPGG